MRGAVPRQAGTRGAVPPATSRTRGAVPRQPWTPPGTLRNVSIRLPGFMYQAIGTILTDHRVAAFHRRLYQGTAGSGIVGHALGVPMILLTTTGRRSGISRAAVWSARNGP